MNVKVVYHSSTGNTRAVAHVVAAAVGAAAEALSDSSVLSEPVDFLFVGDGIYFGGMHRVTRKFIERLDPGMVRCAAAFGTFGGVDRAVPAIQAGLRGKGIAVAGETFSCRGRSWLVINRSHPTPGELEAAAAFARRVAAEC